MTATVLSLLFIACTGQEKPPSDQGGDDTAVVVDTDTAPEVLDDTGGTETDDTGETDDPDTGWPDDDTIYAAFFDPTVIQRIDLTISAEAIDALRADPDTYVEASFVHDDHTIEQIGVKLVGGAASFETIDQKPSFKLKLDEYDDHADYGGLTRIYLHNMEGDESQAREVVASAVWNAAGMIAPLANYAEVYVNDEPFGLYANVEAVDGAFVDRRYTENDGDLWEADEGADFSPGGVDHLTAAAGEGDEEALDEARREIQLGEGAFYEVADVVLDMSQFLDFWAWGIATGNQDLYPYKLDSFYLYANPEVDGRFQFIPWTQDETWSDGFEWDAVTGTVGVHCAYDEACVALLDEHVSAVLTTYEGLDVTGITQAAYDLSSASLSNDTRRTPDINTVLTARSALLSAQLNRPTRVRSEMGL